MRLSSPWRSAQAHTFETVSNSPSETRAEATSIRGTWSSRRSSFAIPSFSDAEKDTPEVCSPSRRVVSMTSTFTPRGSGVWVVGLSPFLIGFDISLLGHEEIDIVEAIEKTVLLIG